MYWRITLDKNSGAVRSCQLVEAAFNPEGDHVYYIDADLKKDAVVLAKQKWAERREQQAEYREQARKHRLEKNECKACAGPLSKIDAKEGHVHCAECRESNRDYIAELRETKKRLGLAPTDPLPPQYRKSGPTGFGARTKMQRYRMLAEFEQICERRNKTEIMRWISNEMVKCAPESVTAARTPLRRAP